MEAAVEDFEMKRILQIGPFSQGFHPSGTRVNRTFHSQVQPLQFQFSHSVLEYSRSYQPQGCYPQYFNIYFASFDVVLYKSLLMLRNVSMPLPYSGDSVIQKAVIRFNKNCLTDAMELFIYGRRKIFYCVHFVL